MTNLNTKPDLLEHYAVTQRKQEIKKRFDMAVKLYLNFRELANEKLSPKDKKICHTALEDLDLSEAKHTIELIEKKCTAYKKELLTLHRKSFKEKPYLKKLYHALINHYEPLNLKD